jgi:hypothetical protein
VYVPFVSLEGVQALQDGGLRDEVLALNKRQKNILRGRLKTIILMAFALIDQNTFSIIFNLLTFVRMVIVQMSFAIKAYSTLSF